MVCHQNSKKSGEFAVCLALRFGPNGVEFGGLRDVTLHVGVDHKQALGLLIKGSTEGRGAVSN